jgi:drug/metabolite transporter (DMT)-like permease
MIVYPFLGALALAVGTIMERLTLKKKQTDIIFHHCLEFFFVVLAMLPFLYFFWHVSPEAWDGKNIFILALVIFFSMIANFFTFYSLKWDKVSNIEPAKIFEPLFVVLLALLFGFFVESSLYETNSKILYPTLIACVALVFSHVKKHHLSFNKYFLAALAGSFFFGLELIISRLILEHYSVLSFYFIRCVALFLLGAIILIFQTPKIRKVENSVYFKMMGLGIIWTLYRVTIYYGYIHLGVISTTLVFMLSPILVYFFAWKFLKEKPSLRNIIASIIIICCVVYGAFLS